MGEQVVQNWFNHLLHTLRIQHGLIKPENTGQVLSNYADVGSDGVDQIGSRVGYANGKVGKVDKVDPERNVFIVAGAGDCSFSRVSQKVAPSRGYRLRKPDIILIIKESTIFSRMADVGPDGTMLRQSWKLAICPP